jgi:hypothetical protein
MSDKAGTGGASYMRDTKDERYVKPAITTPVVITSYLALIACNGTCSRLIYSPRSSCIIADNSR